ncbi:hypothetical protein MML48_1g10919 [Holotrichia oblita]|uniref:Uncharacterized protein n=2 Tax=Holotrichia oblita TaxID=644536 RepID=A0ACB9TV09_HOLOL|nr:hypothetical protein MML48_1g04847 [Holotrichia oblita]KAI4470582.1 hypothetical protein MML48_1g10919 [Holotrichia oblita]
MSFSKYLTQKELESALEEIVTGMEYNNENQHIDAVYIPQDVDFVTDEETMDDESNLREAQEPSDIVGTFELHVPKNTKCLDQSSTLSSTASTPDFDSSDDETLESKRRRMLPANDHQASQVKWKKGQIEYTHTPISEEFRSCEELKNKLWGKSPLEIFFYVFR